MTIWFTADTHFGHANIIKFCGRPFDSKEEHDRVLIENWNSRVQPKDTVYHLGDFGFGDPYDLKKVAGKLKGHIHFIRGNHDKPAILDVIGNRFGIIKDVHHIKVFVEGRRQEIFLSHYAHRTWFKSNHGSWHLWGHSHGNMPPWGLSFDVGVDCWNFYPVSAEEIAKKMAKLKIALDFNPADQHREDYTKELD